MFKIPHITHHWIKPTQYTLKCLKISRIEHVSDFARMQLLHHYGGIYMDSDVYPLRDVRPLRESGFLNIVGTEAPGTINNGFMISRPGSATERLHERAAPRI
jgi:mannosyltransferase OCH1-like enzyme